MERSRFHSRFLLCIWGLILACQAAAATAVHAENLDEWVASERFAATWKLLGATGRNGAVVASPDESTPNQNYYFHWIRDAALTMNVVVSLYENAPDAEDRDEYHRLLKSYVDFSRLNQTASQPSDFSGLGEPKFLITGTVYLGSWGRPQNDGPALRSITLCRWAHLLLDQQSNHPVVVNDIKPIVLDDLAYVRQHWPDACTDLWEEVRGKHFYTRMVQRRALLDGADLLDRLGDMSSAANDCRAQVPMLESAIAAHFDATRNYILATLQPDGDGHGKTSQLDAAVILAVLHGETAGNPFFSPIDDRTLASATALRDTFAAKYPINSSTTDGDGALMEPAIGRYPEDTYNGANNDEGNPWFLATAAFAEHAYRARQLYTAAGTLAVTDRSRPYLQAALNAGGSPAMLTNGETIPAADPRFGAITSGLKVVGDRYLRRVRRHAAADGTLSEQFKGSSGFMTGAVDLTWSYAAVLTAIARR